MATHQLIDNIERTDGIPSVRCLAELAGYIGHVHLGKLLIQVDLHLMLSISQFCIHTIIVTRVDRTKDGLLQSLGSTRHICTIHQVTLSIDACQMLLNGIVESFVAAFVAKFHIVNHTHTADNRTSIENLMELWGYDSIELLLGTFLELLAGIGILITGSRS